MDDEAAEDGGQGQTQEEFLRRGSVPTRPKDRSRSASISTASMHCCVLLYTTYRCSCSLPDWSPTIGKYHLSKVITVTI